MKPRAAKSAALMSPGGTVARAARARAILGEIRARVVDGSRGGSGEAEDGDSKDQDGFEGLRGCFA